jgi:hypothetical protein
VATVVLARLAILTLVNSLLPRLLLILEACSRVFIMEYCETKRENAVNTNLVL